MNLRNNLQLALAFALCAPSVAHAQNYLVADTPSPWVDIAMTFPPCIEEISAPSDSSSWVIVRMSDSRGALVSVSGSSDSSVAGKDAC